MGLQVTASEFLLLTALGRQLNFDHSAARAICSVDGPRRMFVRFNAYGLTANSIAAGKRASITGGHKGDHPRPGDGRSSEPRGRFTPSLVPSDTSIQAALEPV
jgi:hypothetical protein